MERTNKIVNIGGVEIAVLPFITGAEYMKIAASLSNGQMVGPRGVTISESLYEKSEKLLFDTIVVSVNGETDKEKNWQTIQELKSTDFIAIDKLVQNVYKGIDEEEEKK